MKVNDFPKGLRELNPKQNQEIEIKIISTWNRADFIGINRFGVAIAMLHDQTLVHMNGFHEVRAVKDSTND